MGFAMSTMRLRSSAFENHKTIPTKYTGEGDDVSPALSWSDVPDGTRSFALICHDPDAPLVTPGGYGFVHWVLYNIPAWVHTLPEGVQDYTAGKNNFDRSGYGGPMPPDEHGVHHYYFWLLALDEAFDLPPGLSMQEMLEKVEPHVIGMNRLVGTYKRG